MESHRCLASQEIRELIQEGMISGGINVPLDQRIQPDSFEPTLGDEVFILDPENITFFHPNQQEEIYRTLLKLAPGKKFKENISDGFEMKVGYPYLFPLQEKICNLPLGYIIRASPKSSIGRSFADVRLLFDYTSSFNEAIWKEGFDTLSMWLLVQPLDFNLIVGPGLSFNQIRFITGPEAQLSTAELRKEYEKNPFFYTKSEDGKEIPVENPDISYDGLRIHIELEGRLTHGVVGFKTKRNPMPIDLRSDERHKLIHYFEPYQVDKGSRGIKIKPKESFLFSSQEIVKIPNNLCADLRLHSDISMRGTWHRAGFFAPGFNGTATLEVRSAEERETFLSHGMSISELAFFKILKPDEVYGQKIGSHFQNQFGPRPPKWIEMPSLGELARTYDKLNVEVLVVPEKDMLSVRESKEDGFNPISEGVETRIKDIIGKYSFFTSRYNCEEDELILQPIPYTLILRDNQVYVYERTEKMKESGEKRLFGKYSIGVGGHIKEVDLKKGDSNSVNCLENCLRRAVAKEELRFHSEYSDPVFVGTLMAHETPVDRVHFGLIYALSTQGDVSPNEPSIVRGEFVDISELQRRVKQEDPERYETWTKKLVPQLPVIQALYDKFSSVSQR